MRSRIVGTALALALSVIAVHGAEAQRRRGLVDITPSSERRGFWLNLGLGAGTESSRLEPETEYSEGLTKPTFNLRLGGTVSPHLRLGGEIIGWADSRYDSELEGNIRSYLGGVFLVGQIYPIRTAGLFIKTGVGVTRSGEDVDGPGDLHEDGFGWTVGAGYEVRLSRSLYLTPTIDLMQHRSQIRDEAGVLLPAFHNRLLTVGVALTLQPGR
ncbi:MAG: outer membrane beta-barrel protein [Gemmatimonadales bacterium]